MIEIKNNTVHLDDRGWLFEMSRFPTFNVKQITVSNIYPNAIKAFHKHDIQTDMVTCLKGNVQLVTFTLKNNIPENITITYFGEKAPKTVTIPPGTYHGYCSLGGQEATIIYATDQVYNPEDEFRLDYDFLGDKVWQIEHK